MEKNLLSKKFILSLLIASASVNATLTTAHASAPLCSAVFEVAANKAAADTIKEQGKIDPLQKIKESVEQNYRARNEILSKRYPQLDFVFKDPEAFVVLMKNRFEAQKKITPNDPRLFNFPEAAPTMKEIKTDLEGFRAEITAEYQKQATGLRNIVKVTLRGEQSRKVQTLKKVMDYIDKLHGDISKMTDSNIYPYRDTVYTLYYYSRLRGIFQFKELNIYHQVTKFIDMHMHGYRRLNVDKEIALYESQGSPIVQVRSTIAKEFRTAEVPFKDAFERTDALEFVIIPSVYALGSSAFMHVLPHKIHFLGATNTPVPADGFNRPGGLFWMHDVRHEADRYMKISAYTKAQNLTKKQSETMSLLMQQWHADFLKLKNSIKDPNLKESLDHYHFYTHHDVGVPLIPSMFLNHHKNGMGVYYAFLFHKKFAKENVKFTNWFKVTKETQEVLEKFWKERLPIEQQLLQKQPVKLNDWAAWFPKSHNAKSEVALLNKAIETQSMIRLQTDKGGIDGNLTKVVYDSAGNPVYLNFAGPAQLVDRANVVIPGQGPQVHAGGYSTPIGAIKSVTLNGRSESILRVSKDQDVVIQYESGIEVRGRLSKVTRDVMSEPTILTFSAAEVTLEGRTLYKPEWGSFDMLLGQKIESIDFLM